MIWFIIYCLGFCLVLFLDGRYDFTGSRSYEGRGSPVFAASLWPVSIPASLVVFLGKKAYRYGSSIRSNRGILKENK